MYQIRNHWDLSTVNPVSVQKLVFCHTHRQDKKFFYSIQFFSAQAPLYRRTWKMRHEPSKSRCTLTRTTAKSWLSKLTMILGNYGHTMNLYCNYGDIIIQYNTIHVWHGIVPTQWESYINYSVRYSRYVYIMREIELWTFRYM